MPTTAIFGAGVMGETLLAGLLGTGRDPRSVAVAERRGDRAAQVGDRYGVRLLGAVEAARVADTAVLAVKPQDMDALLGEIGDHLGSGALVVSLAAGIPTAYLQARLPDGCPVVRAMPNTPALVGEGMAALSPGQHCTAEHLEEARALLASCGKVVVVPEAHQDAVTAVSGSGPAYLFYVAEAMIDAGVSLGLPPDLAAELVVQTLYGAAALLRDAGEPPSVLRQRVSSPGGTTVAAVGELDRHGVRVAFRAALRAAAHRSADLAAQRS